MVRNTSGQPFNTAATSEDDTERPTVEGSINKSHIDSEKLHDGLANEERERPHKRLGNNSLPMAVCAIENSADLPDVAFLWVHAFPDFVRLALEEDRRKCCTGREISLW